MDYHGSKDIIEYIDVEFLKSINCETPSVTDMRDLEDDIRKNGILNPLVIGVGLWSRKIRLDVGNHRVHLADKLGLTHLPTICRVGAYSVFMPRNGDHSYNSEIIKLPKSCDLEMDYFDKPSDVLHITEFVKK